MDPAQNQSQLTTNQPAAPPPSVSPDIPVSDSTTQPPPAPNTISDNQQPLSPPPPPIPMTGPPQQTFVSSADDIPATPPPAEPPPPSQNLSVSVNHSRRFPFMIVTGVLIIVISGSIISFLFFSNNTGNKTNKNIANKQNVKITPPVTLPVQKAVTPTAVASANPFVSPTPSYENPFVAPTTAYENPFGTYENPFAGATQSAEIVNQPYQNPFEGME